jgi:GxxExxY protein
MLENPDGINPLTEKIIGCAIEVHRAFGAGLLESVYSNCLQIELRANGMAFEAQKPIPLIYREVHVRPGFQVDLLVEGLVVVEVKAVAAIAPVHLAQVITYLKLTGCAVGLLINFNVSALKTGVRRLVHPSGQQNI